MFDMIGVAPICVREDREVQGSIFERLHYQINSAPNIGTDRGARQDFSSDSREGEIGGLNRAKNPVVLSQALVRVTRLNIYLSLSWVEWKVVKVTSISVKCNLCKISNI